MNLLVSDGTRIVATRYVSRGNRSNSLYFAALDTFICRKRICKAGRGENGVLIVSEPLAELEHWQKIENNHVLTVDTNMSISMSPININTV